MFLTMVPLFDEEMKVCAYSVFSQKDNFFTNPMLLGTGSCDGAARIESLDLINEIGIDAVSDGQNVFVPVTNVSIFSDIDLEYKPEHSRIIFLLDRTCPPVDMYIDRVKIMKEAGYGFAIRKLAVSEFQLYHPLLAQMDYVFLNNKKIAIDKAKIYFSRMYPGVKLVAGNIETQDIFETLKESKGYSLYEGDFYRIPLTKGNHDIAPLKITYLELLKVVNDNDFDITAAADVISKDTALTISLLQMVNRVVKTAEITTVRHAAAMLGQKELKRWINAAVVNELYADRPSEMTRLSLLRAKFAENLAGAFGLKMQSEELFLMGLFSILDVVLELPMVEALEKIQVSSDIKKALLNREGKLAPVMDFIVQYESADWTGVSRSMVLGGIDDDVAYSAYVDSLKWYRESMKL